MISIRWSARRVAWCGAIGLLLASWNEAHAQANNGALDLLVPTGARATAMGTAFVAEEGGETVWWNPAGIAHLQHPEFAIDHSENSSAKDDALSLILPVHRVGAFAATARYVNYGAQPAIDLNGNQTGDLLPRSVVVGATFATTFGPTTNAGVTYRLYQFRLDCSGFCESDAAKASTTSAVDVGIQIRPFPSRPLRLGLEVRNLGLSLQVKDQPQADALPTRVHAGFAYDPQFRGMSPALKLRTTAELVSALDLTNTALHAGIQAGYQSGKTTLFARGGYAWESAGGLTSGPALGFGLASGRVQLDLARIFEGVSSALGKPPTYVSIRIGL